MCLQWQQDRAKRVWRLCQLPTRVWCFPEPRVLWKLYTMYEARRCCGQAQKMWRLRCSNILAKSTCLKSAGSPASWCAIRCYVRSGASLKRNRVPRIASARPVARRILGCRDTGTVAQTTLEQDPPLNMHAIKTADTRPQNVVLIFVCLHPHGPVQQSCLRRQHVVLRAVSAVVKRAC
jgi:hypothetical protein